MAKLVHEVWIDADGLEGCCLAGPMGEDARRLFAESGPLRLVRRFVAGSHTEAMKLYHEFLGREPWTTDFPEADSAPYPDEWRRIQEQAGIVLDDGT